MMTLRIVPIRSDQIEAAKDVIRAGVFEFFGEAPAEFDDMDAVLSEYTGFGGTFLVLLDGDAVVGTGAIRRIDSQTCELKRMWCLPAYRGRALGTEMAEALLQFARSAGYRRVRLETAPKLEAANKLYRRLGFQTIDRYNDGPCTIFMGEATLKVLSKFSGSVADFANVTLVRATPERHEELARRPPPSVTSIGEV